jgi:hypothetical protein
LLEGAVKVATDCPLAFDVAELSVGAPGTVEGTMADDGAELTPVPCPLVEATVKV